MVWFNTDGFGLEKAINNELGCKFENADVLILGAGGAARAAAVQALLSGARKIHVHNRSSHSLDQLLQYYTKNLINHEQQVAPKKI